METMFNAFSHKVIVCIQNKSHSAEIPMHFCTNIYIYEFTYFLFEFQTNLVQFWSCLVKETGSMKLFIYPICCNRLHASPSNSTIVLEENENIQPTHPGTPKIKQNPRVYMRRITHEARIYCETVSRIAKKELHFKLYSL